ncbi:MAG: 30S ribosomal protein S16 [Thermotogae bacterium]|nr:30S ribosomal protein S16 [Thermotogota bacterium]
MVKIRLQRTGKRNDPRYRVVVTESRTPRDGKVIEILGYLNPKREGEWKIDLERYDYWISQGAQPTDRVRALVKLARKRTQTTA